MAAVSPPQAGVSGALTPPSSSHGGRGAWEYSVPMNHQTDPSMNLKPFHPNDISSHRQPLSSQPNGISLTRHLSKSELSERRTDATDPYHTSKPNIGTDGGHLQPQRVNVLGRKDSNLSGVGSESDSLLDMYASPNRSGVGSVDTGDRKRSNGDVYLVDDEDPENSRWIHRDKLAKIESQELQQAGIHIAREIRAGSRQAGRRDWSRDHQSNGVNAGDQVNQYYSSKEDPRLKVTSPIPAQEDEPMSFDLRHPDEAAEDLDEENRLCLHHTPLRQPGQKTSYSRIPVSKASPIPIPQDYIERPIPLLRNPSNTWNGLDDDGIAYPKTRSRSQSVGSQVLLDDGEDPETMTPKYKNKSSPQGSPSKTKQLNKGTTGGRKHSASRGVSGQQKSRIRPVQPKDSNTRPITRSGETPPGSSNKRPEGDPPWLNSIYSPDPKLPPEQQLLPTVAKRLQQEQWEREGKYASEFDRELHPLKIHHTEEFAPKPQAIEIADKNGGNDGDWPLRSPSRNLAANGRPGTSGTSNGGYSTMPSLQHSQGPTQVPAAKPIQPVRVQDLVETKKDVDGCGCCIVM